MYLVKIMRQGDIKEFLLVSMTNSGISHSVSTKTHFLPLLASPVHKTMQPLTFRFTLDL